MGFINYPVGDVGSTPALGGVGLAFIASQTFSAASTVSLNGCFTALYDHYLIRTSFTASGADNNLTARLRVNGADTVGSGYNWQRVYGVSTTVAGSAGASAAEWQIGNFDSSNRNTLRLEVFNPFESVITTFQSQSQSGITGQPQVRVLGGYHTGATSFDGFTLLPAAGTITGVIYVYGYQRA